MQDGSTLVRDGNLFLYWDSLIANWYPIILPHIIGSYQVVLLAPIMLYYSEVTISYVVFAITFPRPVLNWILIVSSPVLSPVAGPYSDFPPKVIATCLGAHKYLRFGILVPVSGRKSCVVVCMESLISSRRNSIGVNDPRCWSPFRYRSGGNVNHSLWRHYNSDHGHPLTVLSWSSSNQTSKGSRRIFFKFFASSWRVHKSCE